MLLISHGSWEIKKCKATLYHSGANKLKVELDGPLATVNDLKGLIKEVTEVPTDSQKIIFKGN